VDGQIAGGNGKRARVTPELDAVYAELLERASRAPHVERAQALRERFFERCGRFEADHPAAGSRDAAAWEDALVRGGLARLLGDDLSDPAEREVARSFARAQRGVFVFARESVDLVARDLWSGAQFLVLARDGVGRDVASAGLREDSPPCQARLLATPEGCALLPGHVFHPADARGALEELLRLALDAGLDADDVLDRCLYMEHTFQTMSRVKVAYAYRPLTH
jgi:hypothetical protein